MKTISVSVNDNLIKLEFGSNLVELLNLMQVNGDIVATAVNTQFISKESRHKKRLCQGDKVSIFSPITGG